MANEGLVQSELPNEQNTPFTRRVAVINLLIFGDFAALHLIKLSSFG